ENHPADAGRRTRSAAVGQESGGGRGGAGASGEPRIPAEGAARTTEGKVSVHNPGLPAGAGPADAECAGGERLGAGADPDGVPGAGGSLGAAGHADAHPAELELITRGGRYSSYNVRRTDDALEAGGVGPEKFFWKADFQCGDSAERAAGGGAESR